MCLFLTLVLEIKTIAVTVNSHLRSLVTPEDDEEEDPVVRVMTEAAVNEPVVEDGQEEQHEPSEVEEEETEPRKATSVLEQAGVGLCVYVFSVWFCERLCFCSGIFSQDG